MKFVGVTACPTGIAHTYMAAEKLEEAGKQAGDEVKIETEGSIGAENQLTAEDIAAADGVIIAADKAVNTDRFRGKRVLITGVSEAIEHPEELLRRVRTAPVIGAPAKESEESGARIGNKPRSLFYTALMNGVSHMIPFVVTGGICTALALGIGGQQGPSGLTVPPDSFWNVILQIGAAGFALFVPILSGFIAEAIADRPGLAVGMIAGILCNTNGTLVKISWLSTGDPSKPTYLNTGFIGAIILGFLAGYVAKWLRMIPWHRYIKPIVPILIIPIIGTVVVSLFYVYVLGRPVAALFDGLSTWLNGMSATSKVLIALVIGLMIAFDMGGPVNKVAFLFAGGMISTDGGALMGMAAAAIAVPPLGMGLATLIRRSLFTNSERDAGIAALFMGLFGITEGAIPFAAADPLRVIPSNMVGGAVGAILAGLLGVKDVVMHGGPIVGFLGAATPLWWELFAIVVGAIVTAVMAVGLKSIGVSGRKTAEDSQPVSVAAD